MDRTTVYGKTTKAEAEEKAKAEARKKRRLEARAREEAEARAREEAERKSRAAAEEAARREAEERAKDEEEERIRVEAETRAREAAEVVARAEAEAAERARREAEQRAREGAEARALAESRARAEAAAEEEERRRAEARARTVAVELQAEAAARAKPKPAGTPVRWGKPLLLSLAGLIVALVGLLHVVTLNVHIPLFEKLASDRVLEPVTIGTLRASLWPAPHFKLEGVTVGKLRDVKIDTVQVIPDLATLFGKTKVLREVVLESVSLEQGALPRIPAWIGSGSRTKALQVGQVSLKGVKLAVTNVQLPPFSGKISLTPDGLLRGAAIQTDDGKLIASIAAKGREYQVEFEGKNWRPPIGPAVVFDELHGSATATPNELRIGKLEGRLYNGSAKGAARLAWGDQWRFDGEFSVSGVALQPLALLFTRDISVSGVLDATIDHSMLATSPDKLFDAPRLNAAFMLQDGTLGSFDLVRAIQGTTAGGVSGGQTRFEKLSGLLALDARRYQFKQMKLVSGMLSANGHADMAPDKTLAGRVDTELGTKANLTRRARLAVSGKLSDPVLRRSN